MNVLIVVPHGDDEVLGCGGSIAKHVDRGDHVTVVFTKAPYDERTEKQLSHTDASKKILGYQEKILLNLNDKQMCDQLSFIRELENIIYKTKPYTIYSTFYGDLHQDHRMLFEALNSASRVWAEHRVNRILLNETISSTGQGLIHNIHPFVPNYYNTLKAHQVAKKVQAIQCYTTELRESDHLRSMSNIHEHACMRGRETSSHLAEAFVLMRNLED